jgi:hypothetical protein
MDVRDGDGVSAGGAISGKSRRFGFGSHALAALCAIKSNISSHLRPSRAV